VCHYGPIYLNVTLELLKYGGVVFQGNPLLYRLQEQNPKKSANVEEKEERKSRVTAMYLKDFGDF